MRRTKLDLTPIKLAVGAEFNPSGRQVFGSLKEAADNGYLYHSRKHDGSYVVKKKLGTGYGYATVKGT